jgi:hypothetical protein
VPQIKLIPVDIVTQIIYSGQFTLIPVDIATQIVSRGALKSASSRYNQKTNPLFPVAVVHIEVNSCINDTPLS